MYNLFLVGVTASITASDTNIAGEMYNLVCSITVIGSALQPTITWLDDGVQITSLSDSSRTVSATISDVSNMHSSTLVFDPLSASHAGTYTCRAEIASLSVSGERTFTVQVNVPGIYLSDSTYFIRSHSLLDT